MLWVPCAFTLSAYQYESDRINHVSQYNVVRVYCTMVSTWEWSFASFTYTLQAIDGSTILKDAGRPGRVDHFEDIT
jgi:hypothetical protein